MSHRVIGKSGINSIELVEEACKKFEFPLVKAPAGEKVTVEIFDGEMTVDAYFTPTGWDYPVGIDLATGELTYDNYDNKWGDINHLKAFCQEADLLKAEAAAYMLYADKGYTIYREQLNENDWAIAIEK